MNPDATSTAEPEDGALAVAAPAHEGATAIPVGPIGSTSVPATPADPAPTAQGWAWPTPGVEPAGSMSSGPSGFVSAPPAWPAAPPTLPPVAGSAPVTGGSSSRRSALIGGLAGAVVAAVVAVGVSLAMDDGSTTGSAGAPVIVRPLTTPAGALDIQKILAKVQPSVVAIETSQTTSRGVFQGAGSGVVLSEDGLILTNAHVIAGLGKMTVVLSDGTRHDATLVGASPGDDVAVIRISSAKNLVPAQLGSSDALQVGDEVIAIGNALNLGGEPTVTRGIVSAKDRDLDADGVQLRGLIQTDAAINPGNSGGPLVNVAGQVVGMNTAIVADAQNLGFSIAIDHIRPLIKDLESGKGAVTPNQAFLGVSSTDVSGLTDAVRQRFSVSGSTGAFVTEVVPASAAAEAGIEVGDVIVEIDGKKVETATDVRTLITARAPGDKVSLRISRAGQAQTVEVTLGQRTPGS